MTFTHKVLLWSLSKSLRLLPIRRLPEINFPKNKTVLRMYVGCIQSRCFALVATTSGLLLFFGLFQRISRHFKNSIGYYILLNLI